MVYPLRETHIHKVSRIIKFSSLRDESEDFAICDLGQLPYSQIEEDLGHDPSRLVLRYDQNILIDSICIQLKKKLLYYRQLFHSPISIERLALDCKTEYKNATKGSCLKFITSGSSIGKLKGITSITLSEDEFLIFLYYTAAGLYHIRSSNFRSGCQLERHY